MGAAAYHLAEQAPEVPGCFLEVGIDPGDGEGSTAYLAALAHARGVPFLAVDVDPERCNALLDRKPAHPMRVYCGRGERFLAHELPFLDLAVAFAYLDNHDWTFDGHEQKAWVVAQRERYAALRVPMGNADSQEAHCEQARALWPHLSPGGVILLDDTWRLPSGSFDGKGGRAIPYLLMRGAKLYAEGPSGEQVTDGFVAVYKPTDADHAPRGGAGGRSPGS